MTRDPATIRQIEAADPDASTWLSANAGSGKTRVLIDRVARLLLGGVQPSRILCLTYTKAAASEMQNRLFRRLGEWAMLEEPKLIAALQALGIEGEITAERLRDARRLFARAIETPGGLKIQTIHSFCASLLRRFPLEAKVTPQFVEMDDRAATLLRAEITAEMADGDSVDVIDAVARYSTDEDLSSLTGELVRHKASFAQPLTRDAALRLFDLPANYTAESIALVPFDGDEKALFQQVVPVLEGQAKTMIELAATLRAIDLEAPTLDDLGALFDAFLHKKDGKPLPEAKIKGTPTKNAVKAMGEDLTDEFHAFMHRVAFARDQQLALAAAEKTLTLNTFAARFLPAYESRKAAQGWLDFDDLILKARALLTDPSVAQWVLFRLDGGIDHILVDEAQDTSPDQWAVIELLAQEFTSGRGARDDTRTIFVVGDKKQSIYSFQGADLAMFDAMRARFGAKLRSVNIPLADLKLAHSFRSSQAVLQLVDATFAGDIGEGLGGEVAHIANKPAMPGRVDLWPVIEKTENPEDKEWFDPVDIITDAHETAQLARRIARQIKRMIATGTQIPTDHGPRPMHEGDVLILVQRRSDLFREIIRACKVEGLAIAGADRLKLGAELAVGDLGALLAFLATPEDDLSLAACLRSPLFGWTEGQLYDLAQPRKAGEYLWTTLREQAAAHPDTMKVITDLRNQADFLRPYDLIERILTRHLGRQKLLARLGPEAEDGIDELLSQALAYERMEVPSLTGFLGWMETDDVEVKRQPDSAGKRIRVMTVHGAKGLEAPIVILPDTGTRNLQLRAEIYPFGQGQMVWKTAADASPRQITDLRDAMKARQMQENMRLLYVAMTRAESWLIVCAAGKTGDEGDGKSWYDLVAQGMAESSAAPQDFGFGTGQRLSHGNWPDAVQHNTAVGTKMALTLPDWATTPTPQPLESTKTLSPSTLGGPKALPGEITEDNEEAALQRGRNLHRLLEFLPLWPEARWPDLSRDLLTSGEEAATAGEADALLMEAKAVLLVADHASLFGRDTLAEVAITATLPELGGRIIYGAIDRLLIEPDRILAVDYKSNTTVPATARDTPEGILRQMGAYAAALQQIYPNHRIETAILWTRAARLMPLPHDLVMAALHSTALP